MCPKVSSDHSLILNGDKYLYKVIHANAINFLHLHLHAWQIKRQLILSQAIKLTSSVQFLLEGRFSFHFLSLKMH